MTKLILVRHGHVEGISPERFRGRMDVELTAQGQAEARRTAAFIASAWTPTAIYASPLKRCLATASEIGRATGVQPAPLEALTDIDYGAWQWRTHEEARAKDPEAYALWRTAPELMRFPGGEALQDVVARTGRALQEVAARHPAETVVLVGHDASLRALLLQLLDQPLSAYWRLALSPCGVSEIDVEPPDVRVHGINETAHLR